ncbi:hypothetical protein SeMB42_g03322 [Synchytrium endobioticum]|uniref:SCP domain-containing protein n=1 Tax=Synchytrium endobioticum TaxID=286115 RepID=A0A507D7A1_9FUNG|nr:hypothetical protein SeMB42_g03322 [Synchytrium endobioticum]
MRVALLLPLLCLAMQEGTLGAVTHYSGRRAGPDGRLQRRQALPKCESAIAPPAASGGFTFEKLGTEYKTWQNLARTDPQGFIKSVAAGGKIPLSGEALAFMQKQAPLGALVLKDGLQQCALAIVLDEGPAGLFGHTDSKGRDITARMGRFENLIAGNYTALDGIVTLINDEGIGGRGHRLNIFRAEFRTVGIACGPHSKYDAMCAFDFSSDPV